jgi:hypothetical protein
MPGADAQFLEHLHHTATVAISLGSALRRGFREHNFEIPPEWDELMGCLRLVTRQQLDTLTPTARERLRALAKLVKRAEQTLRRREFQGDFHELFADFSSAGQNLRVALEEIVVSEPDALGWAHDSDSGSVEATRPERPDAGADRDQDGAGLSEGDKRKPHPGPKPDTDASSDQRRARWKGKKKSRGRPHVSDPEADEKLHDDWKASGLTQKEFARKRGLKWEEVEAACKRHRTKKARKKKSPGRRT